MDLPKEIVEARESLEKAETEMNPEIKIEELKEGIDLIERYLEDNPDASYEVKTLIKNLRRSHARRLLSQILSIKNIEFESWLQYIGLLITKLEHEVAFVIEQDPELKNNYDEFYRVWSDTLKNALKKYKEKDTNDAPQPDV